MRALRVMPLAKNIYAHKKYQTSAPRCFCLPYRYFPKGNCVDNRVSDSTLSPHSFSSAAQLPHLIVHLEKRGKRKSVLHVHIRNTLTSNVPSMLQKCPPFSAAQHYKQRSLSFPCYFIFMHIHENHKLNVMGKRKKAKKVTGTTHTAPADDDDVNSSDRLTSRI